MKTISPFLTLVLLLVGCKSLADNSIQRTNPLAKVLSLLGDLTKKLMKDGSVEDKAYSDFIQWCQGITQESGFVIKAAHKELSTLEAKIDELSSEINSCDSEIEALATAISSNEADLKRATQVREKEKEDFEASEKEMMEVVGELDRAIKILKREQTVHPSAFAQVYKSDNMQSVLKSISLVMDAASFSLTGRQHLLALAQTQDTDDDAEPGAPAASKYKFHSSGIIDVLEDMLDKADSQLAELRQKEVATAHNHEMLVQSLEAQIAVDQKDMKNQKAAKNAALEEKAVAEGDHARITKRLGQTDEELSVAKSTCMKVGGDHEASIQARKEELDVIADAVKVLSETTSGAVEQTYSLVQIGLTVQSHTRINKVVVQLKSLAHDYHSSALAQLASRVVAMLQYAGQEGDDPFAKVKGLIQSMIDQLMAEAQSEATEKAYCDEQLAKTRSRKDELDSDISKLTVKIDQASSRSAALSEQVRVLEGEIAEIVKLQAELDKVRQSGHAAYLLEKPELDMGIRGVRQALGLLRSYYGKSVALFEDGAKFAALMQQPALPKTHTKATGAGSGIIDILEVCESDFANSLAVLERQEQDSQTGYEKITHENKVAMAVKEQAVKYKMQEMSILKKKLAEYKSDLDSASAEHAAVEEYLSKIQERCIAKPEAYEARKARRAAGIAGLKEALSILESETAFLQHKKHGNMRGRLTPQQKN